MHTFDLTCSISESMFRRLLNIPGMKQVSEKACKTFYYSSKGFNEITLYVYRFKDKSCGSMVERYYLFLRCNLSVIMGESKTFALNLDGYTLSGLVNGIQKRLYEVNEFRFLNLHKTDIALWRTDRVDIAADIHVENPELLVYMLNMAFPYKKFNMQPYESSKGGVQKTESCYFKSKSRRINIYRKLPEMETHGAVSVEERETLGSLVRVEIQVGKRAIYNMKGLPEDKRNLENFLKPDFTRGYLEKNIRDIFGSVKFVSMTAAENIINKSGYRTETKMVLCSVIRQIHQYGSLYELQRCIEDVNFTPAAYGDKTKFKRLLKKITDLGIHPATIPDESAVGSSLEVPGIYGLLQQTGRNSNV